MQFPDLTRRNVTTLQVNVGKLCNLACHHCHVDAGPNRTEIMSEKVADRLIELLRNNKEIQVLDITGGEPEMNPQFRKLVEEARKLNRRVIDRCNLTILLAPEMEGMIDFLAKHDVEVIASLPCYTEKNVDQQRGRGTFEKSIEALRMLNAAGYGVPGAKLKLDLVYNPLGPYLPALQLELERDYKEALSREYGISFHRLITITNMPIKRFADELARSGKAEEYMSLLVNHFNPKTVPELMCRYLVSVGWDGTLYDCDFNQMLEMGIGNIWEIDDLRDFEGRRISTGDHCFGCTAGAGSSCSGALT